MRRLLKPFIIVYCVLIAIVLWLKGYDQEEMKREDMSLLTREALILLVVIAAIAVITLSGVLK